MEDLQTLFVFDGVLDPGYDVRSPGALRIGEGVDVREISDMVKMKCV